MKPSIQKRLRKAKRRIERRLARGGGNQGRPMFAATNIHYELAEKTRGIGVGGIGVVHRLAQEIGLVDAIDRQVHVLKIHRPYHESDHVLNPACNALREGIRLEDIELRRNDEVFLDAPGTQRIPDRTTAGDDRPRWHPGGDHGGVPGGDGHFLQGHLGVSPAAGLAGGDGRSAAGGEPLGQSAEPRRGRRGGGSCAAGSSRC